VFVDLAFDGAGQPADDAPLGQHEEAQRRQHRQRGESQDPRGVVER
jgi:hypothetical protein